MFTKFYQVSMKIKYKDKIYEEYRMRGEYISFGGNIDPHGHSIQAGSDYINEIKMSFAEFLVRVKLGEIEIFN